MNLLTDAWIPVLRGDRRDTIRPDQVAERDDPVTALNWPRPDFNLACLELLIGLVYMAAPPAGKRDWRDSFAPPDPALLQDAFARYAPAFELDGDTPRFLQDGEVAGELPGALDMLFIDSSGASTAKKNADLMVHRHRYPQLSPAAAAMALFTLQTHAPSGGAGNRTSLRGGGPMVTLVRPVEARTLWPTLWANVPEGAPLDPDALDALPWMRPTRSSKDGFVTQPPATRSAPLETFFSMPRRLWLSFGGAGHCALQDAPAPVVATGIAQRPYGTNYGAWVHPLTPHYRQKEGDLPLPVHPRPGRFSYRNWEGIVLQEDVPLRDRAQVVHRYMTDSSLPDNRFNLIVAGWAMDNMRPLDFLWSEQTMLRAADADRQAALEAFAVRLLRGAELAGWMLVRAVKQALELDDTAKGRLPALRDTFFIATEPAFHEQLRAFAAGRAETADGWAATLRATAMRLANAELLPGLGDRRPEDAGRIVGELRKLRAELTGHRKQGRKLFDLLELEHPARRESAA